MMFEVYDKYGEFVFETDDEIFAQVWCEECEGSYI